ncbi:hypothetical protein [Bacillus velezensis]|uniref:hypothetical protein n=1 Tax=Bacillus velezensis TaxID=492670 RepID=UPI00203EDF65|nr:hypothetical protein [Bacillus velezensis]MCM3108810.1 hypothetical protein [Bacillus velezensis]MED3448976.1 hypothetical protein [Bacillus velezensis]
MFEENVKIYVKSKLAIYKQIIETLYSPAYSTNPEAFLLKDLSNIKLYVVKLSPILGANYSDILYLIHDKDKNLELELIDLTEAKHYENYSKYNSVEAFALHKLIEKASIEKKNILDNHNISALSEELNHKTTAEFTTYINSEAWQKNFRQQMLALVSRDGRKFVEHVNHPTSYYAKDAAKKYTYSLLDLKAIIDRVNDEDFSYQMDQAIAAYENSLYLASCATLGVCLETLCKLLLKENGVKVKDSDGTMLDKLGERLREQKIISYKFKSRIDVCYKVRNLSSHTSPGKVLQGDCHFIIATINEIVDTYFK